MGDHKIEGKIEQPKLVQIGVEKLPGNIVFNAAADDQGNNTIVTTALPSVIICKILMSMMIDVIYNSFPEKRIITP